MSLNDAQRAAVEHVDGPLLVLAGPGSGKTRVVTHRIARLLEKGVEAESVLAVTFTNKSAREMRGRVRSLVGKAAKGLTICTIHSACLRVLRQEIEVLGYGRNFSIYDEGSQASLARTILRDMRGAGATKSARAVLDGVGREKLGTPVSAVGPDGAVASSEEAERAGFVGLAVDRYREELFARNAVDFDDIVLLAARLFRDHPDVLARWRARWRHVLVDEYQDTNSPQDEFLTLLAAEHRNLCVVGDDDQSIYGWRGADVANILGFHRRWPGASVVRLEQNYRSTARVVDVANAVARGLAKRHEKVLFTEKGPGDAVRLVVMPDADEEADFIAAEIAKDVHAPGADAWRAAARHAVLVRTNEQTRPLEQALRQADVPYRLLGGKSFFDRKEVLDVLAYLRLAVNRRDDEALFRVVNVPSRGIGAKSLQAIRQEAKARGKSPWEVFGDVADGMLLPAELPRHSLAPLRGLVELVERLAERAEVRSPTLVADLLRDVGYAEEIDKTYQDARVRESRKALAVEVQAAWESYLRDAPQPSLPDFVDSLSLRDHGESDGEKGGGATISTVHAAKGLEWDSVFVAGCEEGNFPHARSIDDPAGLEEERRLFYVAITRARQRLTLTRSKARELRGRSSERVPSRFLDELPEDALSTGDVDAPATGDAVSSSLERMRAALERARGE